jgi:DNA-binding GntR family transcriptional regulator
MPTMPEALKMPSPPARDFRVIRVAAPLRHSVVESIRNAIATGRFAAGERLTEKDLCEMIGVSRTLVREALRQLESEGLIHVVPHRGPVVARVTVEQAEQLYQVRRELEGLASELFARHASEQDQADLKAALKRLKASTTGADAVERLAAKNEFYACLLRGCGNAELGQVLGLLNSRVTLLRATSLQQKGRLRQSVIELGALVKALVERDAPAARSAARLHVSNAAEAALHILRAEQAG